ncbi:MAG: hydrogenase maturation nickel metallochaperone HypA [Acidobacteria bacterium]|nr:hydrogenase maturation nickel metallochaperone HypA [Acidobacteriota bacterium]
MHEYSIVQSLLNRVQDSLRGYDVRSVRRLRLRLGELSGVDPGLLRTAYELCAPGSVCDGAELEIASVPALWRCPACDRDAPAGARLACPSCGGGVRLLEGDEIVLETIDVEVEHV